MFLFAENESPLLAGHLKLIKTLFTCERVDKKGLGKKTFSSGLIVHVLLSVNVKIVRPTLLLCHVIIVNHKMW